MTKRYQVLVLGYGKMGHVMEALLRKRHQLTFRDRFPPLEFIPAPLARRQLDDIGGEGMHTLARLAALGGLVTSIIAFCIRLKRICDMVTRTSLFINFIYFDK